MAEPIIIHMPPCSSKAVPSVSPSKVFCVNRFRAWNMRVQVMFWILDTHLSQLNVYIFLLVPNRSLLRERHLKNSSWIRLDGFV